MAARVGALALAIVMVVAAIFIRGRIDRAGTTVRLTCATELEAACRAVGNRTKVTIEPAGTTADRLEALDDGADPGLDAWLAPGPWPQIVDDARRTNGGRSPLFTSPAPIVAHTRIGLVVAARRSADLQSACPGPQWSCVGTALTRLVGNADVPDPAAEATGPLVLAAMTSGAAVDDPAVETTLASIKRIRVAATDDAVSNVLTTNGADVAVVAGLDAVVQPILANAANKGLATVLYPSPVTTAEVVLGVTGSGKVADRARSLLTGQTGIAALRDHGWDTPGSSDNVADAGVVAALRAAWKAQQ